MFISPTKLVQQRYPTNTIGYTVLYCNKFITLFTQIIHKNKQTEKLNIFNLTVQYLEKFSSTVQQLAYRGWH